MPIRRSIAGVVEIGEIGLAVGRAIQRKSLADGGNGAQPLRAGHLIDEDQMIFLTDGEIDGLLEFAGKLHEKRPRHGDEIGARRSGQPQDGRPEPHPAIRRRGDQEFFGFQRRDDALHGGPREVHPLRNLAEANPAGSSSSARRIAAARAIT